MSAGGRSRPVVRRAGLRSNPLVRGSDVVQVLSHVLFVVIVLAAAPVAAWVGAVTTAHEAAVAAEQAQALHHGSAVLLQDAVDVATPDPVSGATGVAVTTAAARWATPLGGSRVGTIPVRADARAGQSVTVWLTDDGDLASGPPGSRHIVSDGVASGLGAWLGAVLGSWGIHRLVRRCLDRHRDRTWTEEWAAVAPVWSAEPY